MARPKKKVYKHPPMCEVCGIKHWRSATIDSIAHYNIDTEQHHPKDLLEILEVEEL